MSRVWGRLAGLLATVALLGLVAGLPITLLAVGADLLPERVPSWSDVGSALTSPDDGTLALGAVTVIAWVAWLVLTAAVVLEAVSQIRGVTTPDLRGLGVPQTAARMLVGTALLLFAATPVLVTAPPPAAAAPVTPPPAPAHPALAKPTKSRPATHEQPAQSAVPAAASPRSSTVPYTVRRGDSLWSIATRRVGAGSRYVEIARLNHDVLHGRPGFLTPGMVLRLPASAHDPGTDNRGVHQVTVHRGDTLSEIAEEELGDADRYPEIFRASTGIDQPGGARLTDPDVIDIGWTLNIPGHKHTADRPEPHDRRPANPVRPNGEQHRTPPGAPTQSAPPAPPVPAEPPSQRPATVQPSASSRPAATPSAHGPAAQPGADDAASPAWLLTGLTGGGVILAGSLLAMLRRRRHTQFRHRRPSRTIPVPDPALVPVEKTVSAIGDTAAPTVAFLDTALRRLAAAQTDAGQAMPHLTAAVLTAGKLILHLSDPAELPQPWQPGETPTTWTLSAHTVIFDDDPSSDEQPAPYPLLVTIGISDTGDVWLLNCEGAGTLSVTGDATFSGDFARYLAAELACNPWSHGITVECIGIADEVATMNPERVHTHTGVNEALAEAVTDAVAMIDRTTDNDTDVVTARAGQVGADAWPARLVLLDLADQPPATLDQFTHLVSEHRGHTATAVVLTGETTPRGLIVRLDRRGRVAVPHAQLDLVAVGLTRDEALGCAALLAQADDTTDVAIPDPSNDEGWRAYTNNAGALRPEHTLPRHTPTADLPEPAQPLLPAADADYLADTATTADDLAVLAPLVPARIRAAVADADPTLDADLEAWLNPDCPLPRLTLLGPVGARTHGAAVAKRKPYYTELLTYLTLRPHGATPEEVAEAFNITGARVRNDIKTLRDWLGINPRTGRKHLPDARESPAAQERGISVYQVEDILTDVDLFRRLRVRGETRGPEGIDDLRTALTLVTGQPFDKLRPGGWTWMYEGDRLDQHMVCAIVDVAHLVTTHSLNDNNLHVARAAAETAILAAPYEEIPRLNLAAVAFAEGQDRESARILTDDVCNRSDDGLAPTELPERTAQILQNRDWLNDKAS